LVRDAPSLTAVIPATVHSGHSLQKHRQKDHVHANESGPEMHLAPELAHFSASCFREPVIDAGKKSEDRARRDDVMEMRDDVVGIVQIKIGRIKCQRNTRQTTDLYPHSGLRELFARTSATMPNAGKIKT